MRYDVTLTPDQRIRLEVSSPKTRPVVYTSPTVKQELSKGIGDVEIHGKPPTPLKPASKTLVEEYAYFCKLWNPKPRRRW